MKKRILSVLVAVALVTGLMSGVFADTPTPPTVKTLPNFIAPINVINPKSVRYADWIPISNRAGLEAIADGLDGKYYLTNDIDLSGKEWEPIGGLYDYFTGIFDGQGYVIRNLTITKKSYYPTGLFVNTRNAVFKNVGLEDTNIDIKSGASAANDYYIGTFFGSAGGRNYKKDKHSNPIEEIDYRSVIDNCYNKGKLSVHLEVSRGRDNGGGVYIGGLVGEGGIITNSYNAADITATASVEKVFSDSFNFYVDVGGIVCTGAGTAVTGCYNSGDIMVNSDTSGVGGIISWNYVSNGAAPIEINACYNSGNISIYADSVAGGISASTSGSISNCYNTGEIFVEDDCSSGGIYGSSYVRSKISHSYSYTDGEGIIGTESFTAKQMQQQSSFVGFDFDNVWTFINGENDNMPVLLTFYDYEKANPTTGLTFKLGHVLGNETITISDVLEILKHLAKLDSEISNNPDSFKAACIVGEVPTINDALEILKYLAKLDNEIEVKTA